MLLAGPFLAAAGLLVLAGAQKVADPQPLVRALRSTGLRLPAVAVRLVAAAEVVVGLAGLLSGTRAAAVAVGLSYAVFTAFVLLALARGGVLASCGCFGKADTPPTRTHAALTAGFALCAFSGTPGQVSLPLLVTSAAVGACAYLLLAVQPLVGAR